MNRAVLRLNPVLEKKEWNTLLYTPPNIVSAQEKSQIEDRIEGWVDNLVVSRCGLLVDDNVQADHYFSGLVELELDDSYPYSPTAAHLHSPCHVLPSNITLPRQRRRPLPPDHLSLGIDLHPPRRARAKT